MKTLRAFVAFLLLGVLFCGVSFADTRQEWGLQVQNVKAGVGNINSPQAFQGFGPPVWSQVVSAQGGLITGVMITTNSNPEYIGIFDSGIQPVSYEAFDVPAEAVFYADVPAGTTQFFDFHQMPIRTVHGIYVTQSNGSNAAPTVAGLGSVLVYTLDQNK